MVAQTSGCRARRSLRRRPGTKCLEYVRERSPSRRDGVIMFSRLSLQRSCWHALSSVLESKAAPTQSSCPCGTDRFFLCHSRHFVPGYVHESLRDNESPDDNSPSARTPIRPSLVSAQNKRCGCNCRFAHPKLRVYQYAANSAFASFADALEKCARGDLALSMNGLPDRS